MSYGKIHYIDRDALPFNTYRYVVTCFLEENGEYYESSKFYKHSHITHYTPDAFILYQNYPNPFNNETTFKYRVAQPSEVSIIIYNVLGQRIKIINEGFKETGTHETKWNGLNDNGISVSSGVYIYRMKAGDFVQSKKLVLMK